MQYLSLQPPEGTENLCEIQGQVACFPGKEMQFCSNNVSECYLVANNCPVDNPILCDGECKQLSDSCTSYDSQEEKVESKGVGINV